MNLVYHHISPKTTHIIQVKNDDSFSNYGWIDDGKPQNDHKKSNLIRDNIILAVFHVKRKTILNQKP